MDNLWDSIRRTILAGTGRQPLESHVRQALDLPPEPEAAALQALAVGKLMQQAAANLRDAPRLPEPCPPDPRALCPLAVLKPLRALLAGGFEPAFSEFFDGLHESGWQLPAEVVPQVLDYLARKKGRPTDGVLAVLQPLGPWLARFNPAWATVFPEDTADWHTGVFAERLRLLRAVRQTDPAQGHAWLTQTWTRERAEHRLAFLETFRTGLSESDVPLLERALHDRSLPVRRLACRFLLLLPESPLRGPLKAWLRETPPDLDRISLWENKISEAEVLEPLLAVQPGTPPLESFFQFVPPDDLEAATGKTAGNVLTALLLEPSPAAVGKGFLENIAVQLEPAWANATVQLLAQHPGHDLWSTNELAAVLQSLPAADWQKAVSEVAAQPALLEEESSALVQTLRTSGHTWPAALLQAVLHYPRTTGRGRQARIPEHFRKLLQQAAYRCHPHDAIVSPPPDQEWPFVWHGELAQFRSIVQFRHTMLWHFAPAAG